MSGGKKESRKRSVDHERWEHARATMGFGKCPVCRKLKKKCIYLGPQIGCACADCAGISVSSSELSRRLAKRGLIPRAGS